jgi:hypothetical protein
MSISPKAEDAKTVAASDSFSDSCCFSISKKQVGGSIENIEKDLLPACEVERK